MTAVLVAEKLSGGYGSTEVVREISIRVEAGQVYALVGKNGMGKTTLLKLILGLLPARTGQILLEGVDVIGREPHEIVSHSVSYVPQDQALFQDLSVEENLRLGALRISRRDFDERKQEMSGHFPFLRDRLRQRAGTLSGGEQKMLLLARALVPRPRLILIDEVTEGVQPLVVTRMRNILEHIRRSTGLSILLVEQNIDFAFALADRFGVLNNGGLVDEGDPAVPGARGRAEVHFMI